MLSGMLLAVVSMTSQAACPDMSGSYQFSDTGRIFYIMKIVDTEKYYVSLPSANGKYDLTQTLELTPEERKSEGLPECALLIEGVGMLVKTKKGEKVNVTNQSQNYTNEKIITTEYGLTIFAGFASDIIGVDKISNRVPKEMIVDVSP